MNRAVFSAMKLIRAIIVSWICMIVAERMGPFHGEIRSISSCKATKKNKNLIATNSRQQKIPKHKYNILLDLYLGVDITDQYKANVVMAKKTPHGWKENFFLLDVGSPCLAMKKFIPSILRNLVQGMKFQREDCPLQAGNYSNIVIQPVVEVKSIPVFFYDFFRLRAMVQNNSDLIGCIEVIASTAPN